MKTKSNSIIDYIHEIRKLNLGLTNSDIYLIFEHISKHSADEIILNEKIQIKYWEKLKLRIILKKVLKGIPLAYILKQKTFYGLTFFVNKKVLIPRSDSEYMIDYANEFIKKSTEKINLLDLCAGSGCLGITAAYLNQDKIESAKLVDISKKAIAICQKNTKKFNLSKKVELVKSDITKTIWNNKKYNLVLCNPPYIDLLDSDIDHSTFRFEPHIALFAEDKGLYFYKIVLNKIEQWIELKKPFMLIFEIGWNQKKDLEEFLKLNEKIKYKWEFKKDYSSNWRNLIITNKGV